MERSGSLLRDRRHYPVLLGEKANRVRRPRSAARGKRGHRSRENDQQAGQLPHPIGALRVCDCCHPELHQPASAGSLRPAQAARQAPEGGRGGLHAEASGDRVRPEGQQRTIRPYLREALEGSAGGEEIHRECLCRTEPGPELRPVRPGLSKRSKGKEEGLLAREER